MLWSEGSKAGPQVSGSGDPKDTQNPSWPALRGLDHCLPSPCPRASNSVAGRCRRWGSCKGEVGLGWWVWRWVWVCGEGVEEKGRPS